MKAPKEGRNLKLGSIMQNGDYDHMKMTFGQTNSIAKTR